MQPQYPDWNLTMMPSDDQLMLLVLQHDAIAFERLVERWQQRLVTYFFRHLTDLSQAEDLSQEVLINVWKAKRYAPGAFSRWIYKLAHNKLMDHYRRKSLPMVEINESVFQLVAADNQEEQMLQQEKQNQVQQAIHALPINQQNILILSKYQELDHENIAQVMGCTKASVKVLLFRAVQRLSQVFKEMYPHEIK